MELDLQEIRKLIDEIDKKLIGLFEKRMDLLRLIAKYKKEKNLSVLDLKREEIVNKKNILYLSNKEYTPYLKDFFKQLMRISCSYQRALLINNTTTWKFILGNLPISEVIKNPTVGYGATGGYYGERAVLDYFRDSQSICYQTFEEVVNSILNNSLDYGVIPLENTSSGIILDVMRLIGKFPVYIVGEILIAEEYSKNFNNKPWYEVITSNTAINNNYVAKVYGFNAPKESIYYCKNSYMRFGIIKKSIELSDKANKISIIFILGDKQCHIHFVAKVIAEYNLNIIKIESKTIPGTYRKHIFFIDFSGNLRDTKVKRALFEIKENSKEFYFKGNYIENARG